MDATMPKPIQRVGHVVLKMRDLEKARQFYCGVLGMTLANFDPDRGMFLRFDDYHHDIAIFKTGPDADPPKKNQVGLVHVALVVRDYDEAIEFYTQKLHFTLVEDTYQPEQDKRWVVVAPPGSTGTTLLLARASKPEQEPAIGNQTGGRVFLFLETDDFWRDYQAYKAKGVVFVREPREESYGTVAVFKDLYGNLWDLLQRI